MPRITIRIEELGGEHGMVRQDIVWDGYEFRALDPATVHAYIIEKAAHIEEIGKSLARGETQPIEPGHPDNPVFTQSQPSCDLHKRIKAQDERGIWYCTQCRRERQLEAETPDPLDL